MRWKLNRQGEEDHLSGDGAGRNQIAMTPKELAKRRQLERPGGCRSG